MSQPTEMPVPALPTYQSTVADEIKLSMPIEDKKNGSADIDSKSRGDFNVSSSMPEPILDAMPMPSRSFEAEKQYYSQSSSDERPLPIGWIQQYDHQTNRVYYVNTHTYPARSIWTHPLDDEEYQRSLGGYDPKSENRDTCFNLSITHTHSMSSASNPNEGKSKRRFGSYLKDKISGTNQAEREEAKREKEKLEEEKRRKRKWEKEEAEKKNLEQQEKEEREKKEREAKEEEERRKIAEEKAIRNGKKKDALKKATETGMPQLLWQNEDGEDVFARPPPASHPWIKANIGLTPYMDPATYQTGPGWDPNYQAPIRNRTQNYNNGGGGGGGGGSNFNNNSGANIGMAVMGGLVTGLILDDIF